LLVLVLSALIFLWARGFISEQVEKFGKPIEQLCGSVNFEAHKVDGGLEVINRGDIDIRYLDIKMFKGGDSEIEKFDFQIDAGESVHKNVVLTMSGNVLPDEIIVYPALIGSVKGGSSNKAFTCMEAGRTL